ncbi:MAG: DUF3352 domain-containing protein [Gaiellales bacterium]
MKVSKRGGLAVIAMLTAALIAAGCGGGGSKAADAAKSSKVLDLVPKSAIGYATLDTNFTGDNWKQFNKLASGFNADFEGVDTQLSESAGKEEVDYAKDVDPWLGDTGGAALLSMPNEGDAEFFAWVELDDVKKFEAFAKDDGLKAGDKIGDYKTLSDPDEDDGVFLAYNDDHILLSDKLAVLSKTIKYDGDSITKVDGIGDAIDEVGADSLGTIVVSGEGVRALVKDNAQASSTVGSATQLKELNAVAVSFGAEDKGMRVTGYVDSSGKDSPENGSRDVLEGLPANTVFALGGQNFGGGLKTLAEDAGKTNPQVQQMIGAGSAALGVDVDDLSKAFADEFALGLGSTDEGLGALAGGVTGAAMGGGLGALDPSALTKALSITIAFSETGSTKDTLDKLTQAAGGFLGASGAPKTAKLGDFETTTISAAGMPVTTASSKDIAAISLGVDVFENWGKDSLSSTDAYKDAVKAAGTPGKTAGFMWVDAGRIATFAGVKSAEDVKLGGLVGWVEGDKGSAKFSAFMHIDTK